MIWQMQNSKNIKLQQEHINKDMGNMKNKSLFNNYKVDILIHIVANMSMVVTVVVVFIICQYIK